MRFNASETIIVPSYKVELTTQQLDHNGKEYVVLEEAPSIYKIIVLDSSFVSKNNHNALKDLLLKYMANPSVIRYISTVSESENDKFDVKMLLNSAYGVQNDTMTLLTNLDTMIRSILATTKDYEQKLLGIYRQNINTASDIAMSTRTRILDELYPKEYFDGKKPTE